MNNKKGTKDYTTILLLALAVIGIVLIIIFDSTNNNKVNRSNNKYQVVDSNYSDSLLLDERDSYYLHMLEANIEVDSLYSVLHSTRDSLYKIRDSLVIINKDKIAIEESLIVSNIKLERIREYNRIAAQGNNITFLRGWINRVLAE